MEAQWAKIGWTGKTIKKTGFWIRINWMPVCSTRAECLTTFLSVIYEFSQKVFVLYKHFHPQSNKHSSLERKIMNYGQKMFYDIGPSWEHRSWIFYATFIWRKIRKLMITRQPLKPKEKVSADLESTDV